MVESSMAKGELQMRFVPTHKTYYHHLATYSFEVDGREGLTNPTVHFVIGFKGTSPSVLLNFGTKPNLPPPANKYTAGQKKLAT